MYIFRGKNLKNSYSETPVQYDPASQALQSTPAPDSSLLHQASPSVVRYTDPPPVFPMTSVLVPPARDVPRKSASRTSQGLWQLKGSYASS